VACAQTDGGRCPGRGLETRIISQVRGAAAERAADFDAAYRALRADGRVQFVLPPAPPPAKTPDWVEALGQLVRQLFSPIGRFLRWIGSFFPDAPFARAILWILIVSVLIALVVVVVSRIRSGQWAWPRRSVAPAAAIDDDWRPDASPLRAWLAEADALAGQHRFADAIHCLLLRSIEDLSKRRPELARPSLTARELSESRLLPVRAQPLFAAIAGEVERSLFGRRAIDEAQWLEARGRYSEFAQAGTWQR
jgi:ABC-type cobalt transport system substrate-binding protein